MLGLIHAVTTTVPDIASIEAAYSAHLGYKTVEHGIVSPETAHSWGAPNVAGRKFLIMVPESGEPAFLRFVEATLPPDWRALQSFGWNATELIIQDPDALAAKLEGSPFRVIGPPKDLDGFPMIRALQVIGPGGECLYLTRVNPGSGFELPEARSFVGRVFIAVLSCSDLETGTAFYAGLGHPASESGTARIQILADSFSLPSETEFTMTMVQLATGNLIEVDQYPSMALPRTKIPGELPPGMAIVTLGVSSLDGLKTIAPPTIAQLPPFAGRRCATLQGPSGELLELIEEP